MIVIGFTGTRWGMTPAQRAALALEVDRALDLDAPWLARHGMCVGSDEEFHNIVRPLPNGVIHGHPSNLSGMTARITDCDVLHEPKRPLARNVHIVAASTVMLAAPAEMTEQLRGGTWATIRMARRARKPLAIVWPDGSVTRERWV